MQEERRAVPARVFNYMSEQWRAERDRLASARWVFMLSEDIVNNFFPYRASSEEDVYSISLAGGNEKDREVLADALSDAYAGVRLEDAILDFARNWARAIVIDGQVFYEIVPVREAGNGSPVGFMLELLPVKSISRKGGSFTQNIPELIAAEYGVEKTINIPGWRCVSARIPTPWGNDWRKMVETLASLSGKTVPEFALEDMTRNDKSDFDTEEYQSTEARAVAATTAACGWDARGSFREQETVYYSALRATKFAEFLAALRKEFSNFLNRVIENANERVDISGEVVISGLPSSDEIAELRRDLRKGRVEVDALSQQLP